MCKLYSENEGLVKKIYNMHFRGMSAYKEDLLQEGYMELWRAANNYVEGSATKFSTYATTCIRGKMMWFINKNRTPIKPSEELIKLACKVNMRYGSIAEAPTDIYKVMREFKCSEDTALGLHMLREGLISLDSEVKDSEEPTTLGDLYALSSTDVAMEVEDKMMLEQFVQSIDTDRDRLIFLDTLEGESYTDISKKVHITSQQVGRIAKKLCKEYLELKGVAMH